MKTYRPWALAVVLALPVLVSAAEPTTPPCAASSSTTGYGIEMIDLIDKVAKRTGKQFIVDPRVRAQVSNAGLDLEKVDYAKLLAILNVHQFAAYEANGVVRVVPDANARQLPIPVTTEIPANALDDEYVTVMITAKNMCMAHAVPVLRPLMPQAAHMAAFRAEQHADHLRSCGQRAPHRRHGRAARQGGARRPEVPAGDVAAREERQARRSS